MKFEAVSAVAYSRFFLVTICESDIQLHHVILAVLTSSPAAAWLRSYVKRNKPNVCFYEMHWNREKSQNTLKIAQKCIGIIDIVPCSCSNGLLFTTLNTAVYMSILAY